MCKQFCCAIHLFLRQNKVLALHLVDPVVLNFDFDLVLPFSFSKWNHYFAACQNLPNSPWHFWKYKLVFLHILHQYSVPSNITAMCFLSSNLIYFGQRQPIKVQISEIFDCTGQNLSNSSCQFRTDKSIPVNFASFLLSWHIFPP